MKWMNTLLLIFLIHPVFAQEISLDLQFSPDSLYNSGVHIQALDDDFIIMGPTACSDGQNTSPNNCLGLMRVDREGKVLWRKVYNGGADDIFYDFNLKTLVVHNDTLYTAGYVDQGNFELRLAAFNEMGEFLFSKDLAISNENFFVNGMIFSNNSLLLFGSRQSNGSNVFIRQFDLDLNLLADKDLGSTNKTIRHVDLSEASNGEYLLVYEESVQASQVKIEIRRLDDEFEITAAHEIPEGDLGDPGRAVNILEAEDGGYVVGWHKDLSYTLFDTFPFPSTIYKLDTAFQLEWEYVFVHKAAKEHLSLVQTSEGHFFGTGATDYSNIHDIFPQRVLDGWCFLLDEEGNLLWERIIADISEEPPSGAFRHGLETENGFVLVGDIGMSPNAISYDAWLLTLDENGCWNGNCDEFIVINGETTTHTEGPEAVQKNMEVYPNPTVGTLTIDCPECLPAEERQVEIFNAQGARVLAFDLRAPKSTINLSELEDGIYFIVHSRNGVPVESRRVLVAR